MKMKKMVAIVLLNIVVSLMLMSCGNAAGNRTNPAGEVLAVEDDLTEEKSTPSDVDSATKPEGNNGYDGLNGTEYIFLNGKMTIPLSEDAYNVLVEDIDPNSPAIARLGLDKSRIDQYMRMASTSLEAYPVSAGGIGNSDLSLNLKIKEPEYTGVYSLNNFTQEEREAFALEMLSSFTDVRGDYAWFESNGIPWLVFECDMSLNKQLRYATVIDGRMIYLYFAKSSDYPNAEEAEELKAIVQSIKWNW